MIGSGLAWGERWPTQIMPKTSTALRINRIEHLNIPFLSRFTGGFRYEFVLGALRGHTFMPNPAYVANPSSNVANVTTLAIHGCI